MRLDRALIHLHPELSRRRAREVIEKGQVWVGDTRLRDAGAFVQDDAPIRWDPHQKALPRARLDLVRLHEDDALLIVDKPAGLLSVPSSLDAQDQDEDTALLRVQDYVGHLRPRDPYVGLVHRLDRDTSGALAFALARDARAALRTLFREHRVERRYEALALGHPPTETGVVEAPLHTAYTAGRRRVARSSEPSLPALTRWRVLERFAGAVLLEIELGTGRQHQVRVHLAHIGLPVLGDPVYGRRGPQRIVAPRQMLHARYLAFRHPIGGSAVRAESPRPPDFLRMLERLRSRRGSK